ncbi:MAG TPA: hypothetical protein ENN79_04290 [Desulfobacteraceae bacterium]|nr:hypothetical protein [Desulfobacteraceae bacterium]
MSIAVEVERCAGCRLCELACSFARYGHFNPAEAGIQVTFKDDGTLSVMVNGECNTCRKPLCVAFCPVGAIKSLVDVEKDEHHPVQTASAG